VRPVGSNRRDIDAVAYDARMRALAASGAAMHGEADFVAAMAPRRVLDAGCGTGRVAIELARRGIDVVGIDAEAAMIAVARGHAPTLDWRVADLAESTATATVAPVDVAVMAGNVMIFVAPGTEGAVVANVAAALLPGGALVAGFQLVADRVTLAEYDEHGAAAGLELVERYATWDRAPFDGGDYAVSVHRRPA